MAFAKQLRILVAACLCFAGGLVASAQTTKRPLQDWIAPNLGTNATLWYDADAPPPRPTVSFDYFGATNAFFGLNLGTQLDGTITETRLRSGRVDVHIVLHSRNVLTQAFDVTRLIFGHSPYEILLAGADPALGDTLLTVDFENSAPGAPLPSLNSLLSNPSPNYRLEKVALIASGDGPLRAAFGVPDGTRGRVHTTQRGLFGVPGMKIQGHDVYPAEKVIIHALGH